MLWAILAFGGQFIEPIDELGPSAFLSHLRCEGCWTSLIEGLKRLGGDNRRIGCPLLKLAPDRSMK
jgi:hypothetical protein